METFEFYPDNGTLGGIFVRKEDHDAEVARLKRMKMAWQNSGLIRKEKIVQLKFDYQRLERAASEVARIHQENAERLEGLREENDRLKAQLAELRETVAWYFECIWFSDVRIDYLQRHYQTLGNRSHKEWLNWRYRGKDSAEAILPAAEAELKRLAGVE